jgi:hypothetical protein
MLQGFPWTLNMNGDISIRRGGGGTLPLGSGYEI